MLLLLLLLLLCRLLLLLLLPPLENRDGDLESCTVEWGVLLRLRLSRLLKREHDRNVKFQAFPFGCWIVL